jgi:hypothetical protein
MLSTIEKIVDEASVHLQIKNKMRFMINASLHFQERFVERFADDDAPQLERTIEKAIEKIAVFGKPTKYTHPQYGITVVITKYGINCAKLVSCWKGVEC